MTYAIILAGGVGSRFWPLSSSVEPKQFLDVCSNRPMIYETVERIMGLIDKDKVFIAANKTHAKKIRGCLKYFALSAKNIFFEPEGKNTLAPIAFLCKNISSIDDDSVVVVLPCDHYIRYQDRFLASLRKAIGIARAGYIVTMGIVPKRPETGYGYIKAGKRIVRGKIDFYKVEKFIEKPDLKKASQFVKDKRYYWNSGIFIFNARLLLDEIKKLVPDVYKIIACMADSARINQLWPRLRSISIDYAVMEKTDKIVVLPADYGWIDIGSWQAIEEVMKKDERGNIFKGNCLDVDSSNSLVWSEGRIVATLGLENIIVVETKNGVLVCAKDKAQEVRRIVKLLNQKKSKKI